MGANAVRFTLGSPAGSPIVHFPHRIILAGAVRTRAGGYGPSDRNERWRPVMTDEYRQPLEETQEVADAIEDDVSVNAFMTGGGPDDETPEFVAPGERDAIRTGADQPWDPEDLAVAEGRDPTPENIERARKELEEDGPAAIERTVP
jgi:hypothetical protein